MPGYLNKVQNIINRYDINFYSKNNTNSITLIVNTDCNCVRYNISTDVDHPDPERIYNDLRNGLSYAFDHGENIFIDDQSEWNFIRVTYPNGDLRKYSAFKHFIFL